MQKSSLGPVCGGLGVARDTVHFPFLGEKFTFKYDSN